MASDLKYSLCYHVSEPQINHYRDLEIFKKHLASLGETDLGINVEWEKDEGYFKLCSVTHSPKT